MRLCKNRCVLLSHIWLFLHRDHCTHTSAVQICPLWLSPLLSATSNAHFIHIPSLYVSVYSSEGNAGGCGYVIDLRHALQEPVAFGASSSKDNAVKRRSSSFDGWLSSGPKPPAPSKPSPSSTSSKSVPAEAAGEASGVCGLPVTSLYGTLTSWYPSRPIAEASLLLVQADGQTSGAMAGVCNRP